MRPLRVVAVAAALALLAVGGVRQLAADSQRQPRLVKADLQGYEEVPAISSTGSGEFRARIASDESSIEFELQYENLEGTITTAAHVHLGQSAVNGGVMFFLCGGGGKPACPTSAAIIAGTIVPSDIIGPAAQGLAAGEFEEALNALRSGATYANVHTNKHPGGEIRGQIK
jgi:hypothetical protein